MCISNTMTIRNKKTKNMFRQRDKTLTVALGDVVVVVAVGTVDVVVVRLARMVTVVVTVGNQHLVTGISRLVRVH